MKILRSNISDDLKVALISRGLIDTEDLGYSIFADDLEDIKKNESSEVATELDELIRLVNFIN